ncbi:hypothetical protein PFISCL1PPCAC_21282, partial [Pristionchus fissidentatus]
ELKDVKYEEFLDLLQVIYPCSRAVTYDTVKSILALAGFYQIKFAMDCAHSYLIRTTKFNVMEKIKLADQYKLDALQHFCLQSFKNFSEVKNVHKDGMFETLSKDMQCALYIRTMELPAQ